MNTNTGEVYATFLKVEKARKRGEPLVEISEKAAQRILSAYKAKKAAEQADKAKRRKRNKTARASRARNRP